MTSLKYIFFFALISYTFQLDHCIQAGILCQNTTTNSNPTTNTLTPSNSIANCIKYDENDRTKCSRCDKDYAVSHEKDKCISSSFCVSLDKGNEECAECYEGYYWNGNACTKIPINYCLSYDDDENICISCADFSKISEDGKKCELKAIDGCKYYENNGVCAACKSGYDEKKNNEGIITSCEFKGCAEGKTKVDYCEICEFDYYRDNNDGKCKPYKASNSNYSKRNKIGYTFLILTLALLI